MIITACWFLFTGLALECYSCKGVSNNDCLLVSVHRAGSECFSCEGVSNNDCLLVSVYRAGSGVLLL